MQPCGLDPWQMTRRVRGGFCHSTFKRSAELGGWCSLIAPNTMGGNKPCKTRTINVREGNTFCRLQTPLDLNPRGRVVVDGRNVLRSYAGAPSPTVRVLAIGTERSSHANQATACVLPLWLASCSTRARTHNSQYMLFKCYRQIGMGPKRKPRSERILHSRAQAHVRCTALAAAPIRHTSL